ncbi:hypothetical protein [Chryseobacterium fistulae]|uniref:HEPN AbiU2-like domain-containing protein n=1 Tax=Chryseobacterium fistulae TaxID=2675058 RepID=A0A6N4XNJ5_9FLAO|nr:hypothetical protein [Chryseobacterium fistulae]CAA7386753.1 hypothetical protein CHRY9393_01053 [Chryseobacterium fistulae]
MQTINEEDKKFYESLFILFKCHQTINNLWGKLKVSSNKFLNGCEYNDTPLLYLIILEVVSYNDEYNSYFNEKKLPKYKERINQIKEINKLIFKEINKWKLKDFRNNIIAHPWRNRGKFAHPDTEEYCIPRNLLEFYLLINYINYTWSLIEVEFKNEFKYTLEYMLKISPASKGMKDYSKLNETQVNLVNQVNKKCMEFQKKYYLKVVLYDFTHLEDM